MQNQPIVTSKPSPAIAGLPPAGRGTTNMEFNPAPLVSAIAGGLSAVPGVGGALGGVVNGALGGSGEQLLPTLIDKQVEVQRETLAFNLRSNIVKSHHDARMSAVRNMKA